MDANSSFRRTDWVVSARSKEERMGVSVVVVVMTMVLKVADCMLVDDR